MVNPKIVKTVTENQNKEIKEILEELVQLIYFLEHTSDKKEAKRFNQETRLIESNFSRSDSDSGTEDGDNNGSKYVNSPLIEKEKKDLKAKLFKRLEKQYQNIYKQEIYKSVSDCVLTSRRFGEKELR